MVYLPDTPKFVALNPDDEPMDRLENCLEEEDDLEENQEIDEVVG